MTGNLQAVLPTRAVGTPVEGCQDEDEGDRDEQLKQGKPLGAAASARTSSHAYPARHELRIAEPRSVDNLRIRSRRITGCLESWVRSFHRRRGARRDGLMDWWSGGVMPSKWRGRSRFGEAKVRQKRCNFVLRCRGHRVFRWHWLLADFVHLGSNQGRPAVEVFITM